MKKLSVVKDGGDVNAITASTITSRAFCDALSKAVAAFDAITGAQLPADSVSGATVPEEGQMSETEITSQEVK